MKLLIYNSGRGEINIEMDQIRGTKYISIKQEDSEVIVDINDIEELITALTMIQAK